MNKKDLKDRDTDDTDHEDAQKDHTNDNPYSRYYSKEGSADKADPSIKDDRENENPYSKELKGSHENSFASSFKVKEQGAHCSDGEAVAAPRIDEAREKNNLSRIGMGYMLFSLISTAVACIIQFAVLATDESLLDNMLFRNLLSPVCLYLFALPVLLLILSRCEAKAPEKRRMGVGSFILCIITAFGLMYIGAMIGNTVMDFLSGVFNYDYSNGLESIIDEENIWLTAIFTVIVAPIGEEFVFRKLIIDRTQKYGAFVSIGLSGLMFGLMHGNFYQFFYAFALGLLLGYIYYSTGKLHLTVIIHAVVNFVGSVLTSFLSPITEKLLETDLNDPEIYLTFIQENLIGLIVILVFDLFVYASMACAVIFPIVFRKKLKFPKGELSIQRGRVVPIVILNAGILLMLAVYLLEFGINIFLPLI